MKLSVFGLGYVGCVSAACFARDGHEVIGVDVNPLKVEIINDGRSPIVEPGIEELIAEAVAQGRLRATTSAEEAVLGADLSLVCIGTPSNHNGSLDLTYIKRACQQIGEALARKNSLSKSRYHIVAIRSTMLPGTVEQTVIPTLEVYSGKRAGRDFGVAVNPEFLREGTSLYDFSNPPFTLIGADDEETAGPLQRLYAGIEAPVITTRIKEAEMVKYACNAFHALKVTFANEIGNICKALGVDSHRVMEIFCEDRKLNLSPYYLKPGFAFGGSCLPKDLRAITYKARELDQSVPLLNSIMPSNRQQVERAVDAVLQTGRKRVGVLGLSFKSGTDDLRESPMVTLIETLIGKGLKLSIYDRDVELARLFGANKEYIEREIPHISSLMNPSLEEVIESSEIIIIGKKEDEFRVMAEKMNNGRVVLDLVRLFDVEDNRKQYVGICW
ncbi:MAG: UDP-glucose/GDP-mannose dehydrogenase family protein [Blastocatellia bacterium]|nr:UDP-glucose/GDP-mannose dehydrogenase family protein [Blastocatellia bacterium]